MPALFPFLGKALRIVVHVMGEAAPCRLNRITEPIHMKSY